MSFVKVGEENSTPIEIFITRIMLGPPVSSFTVGL